jgi:hypothetical protein
LCLNANELQLLAKYTLRPDSLIIRWISGALIFGVLFCGALAVNPRLHRLIHPDADNDHHQCAITIFAHGKVDLSDGNPAIVIPILHVFPSAVALTEVLIVSRDFLLLPGRAPPVIAS